MSKRHHSTPLRPRTAYALSVAFFLVLSLGTLWASLRVFSPERYEEAPAADHSYSLDAMQSAVDWRRVKAIQDDLLALGPRFMGQPGVYATEDYIRTAFRDAGLELHEQENWTVVPRTQFREIFLADANGAARPLTDVQIYPFMPNHLQPVTTPDDGVAGELVVLTPDTLRNRESFDGCIGLIDTSEGMYSNEYAFDWTRYAQLGLEALVVSHPDGLNAVPWHRVANESKGMVSGVPINFVRVAADNGIFNCVGRRIRLRVRVRFEEVPNTTLVGILRAGTSSTQNPNSNAVILVSSYDACSILPDRAPGVSQALWPATQLALLEGLAPYRDTLSRDVVFIAFGAQMMARDGENNLLRLLDENLVRKERNPFTKILGMDDGEGTGAGEQTHRSGQQARLKPWKERRQFHSAKLAEIDGILDAFENDSFLTDALSTLTILDNMGKDTRTFVEDQVTYTLDAVVFNLTESKLQAKLAFLRSGNPDPNGEPFMTYLKRKTECDRMVAVARYSLPSLLDGNVRTDELLLQYAIRDKCRQRFEELRAYHARRLRQREKDVSLIEALNPYKRIIVFDTCLMPTFNADRRDEILSFSNGHWAVNAQMRSMVSMMASARQRVRDIPSLAGAESQLTIPPLAKLHHNDVALNTRPLSERSINMWTQFGYFALKLLSFGRSDSYLHFADPVDQPYMHDVESLKLSLAVVGETVLSLAHGNGRFAPIQVGWMKKQFGGRVLASGIGQSMTPHYPLKGAVLASRPYWGQEYSYPGFYDHLLIVTDPYGRYEIVNCATDFWVDHYIWAHGYSPVAAWHGPDGGIAWMKDEGEDGQRLYKSVNLNWFKGDVENITLVAFRAAPVAFLDMTNPQTMQDYTGLRLINRDGLSAFRKQCAFNTKGIHVHYIEPDEYFYVTLESGSVDNELAKVTRGFMLGEPSSGAIGEGLDVRKEIDGEGYLAADHPIMQEVPREVARSMAHLNAKRLALQNRHHMADSQTNDYLDKSLTLLAESEHSGQPARQATQEARTAVVYNTLNHPVLRESIVEALIGILWYLALLVPFVYFVEKLLFCFSDIRKQLAVQAVLFPLVFALLRFMHPAFEMVRSSLMILLGFIIILIAGGMSVLFFGKFKENLQELRMKRGRIDAAEVNKIGVMGSAFMLGLNNMHRRKMRTWLTCATLTLITFAMICFTSTESDIVEEAVAVGKAQYQGILIKRQNTRSFSEAELFALRTRYADKHQLCLRQMHLGRQNWEDKRGNNPELEMVYETDAAPRGLSFSSVLQFSYAEPLQHQIRFLTDAEWFTKDEERASETICPIFIPDAMAERLGISPTMVASGGVKVFVNGRAFLVRGIFEARSLDNAVDLDGTGVLPYDVEGMAHIQVVDNQIVADENDPRIPARDLIIAPLRPLEIQIPNDNDAVVSVALSMPDGPYREVREAIATYLEQSGEPAYYGIDGVAYRGKRTRERSVAGIVDLIIPLLVAAMTVLNTMRGSVYERRDEIEVYNAVGIAPRYVFLMFFAEAFVYVVVGSVLGYLLSQGAGRVLTMLDLTGGMNMTFTSLTTIYASLAVAAAVFISTYFPARSAMTIAKPTDDAGWSLPEPDGDRIAFDLPFNFDYRDRMAVLTFFERYLEDHGEGGSGLFFSSKPSLDVAALTDDAEGRELVPRLTATVWVKPFDLGVSQTLELRMTTDEETGEFKASLVLVRLSGTREAWLRLNRSFVAEVRRQFLHWRVVTPEDRETMFAETRAQMEAAVEREPV